MSEKAKKYVPKHRLDNFYLEELFELDDKEIEPVAYDLLVWLKDMSQPISKELIPLLKDKIKGIKKEIINLLDNEKEDSILKYNIIEYVLFDLNKEELKDFEKSLKRIVDKPTKYENFYEANLAAKRAIEQI